MSSRRAHRSILFEHSEKRKEKEKKKKEINKTGREKYYRFLHARDATFVLFIILSIYLVNVSETPVFNIGKIQKFVFFHIFAILLLVSLFVFLLGQVSNV